MRNAKYSSRNTSKTAPKHELDWSLLLREAVEKPGSIMEAYSAFHNYSLGNQQAALFQCRLRGIPVGPINTFNGWKEKGRSVQKGSKAIILCMPFSSKGKTVEIEKSDSSGNTVTETTTEGAYQAFGWRANWFVLSQTEGEEFPQAEVEPQTWDKAAAMSALDIVQEPFAHVDGNCQGYAKERVVAVSPLAQLPHKTLFHEMAHVVLGHTQRSECSDSETMPRSLIEAEAEGVAYLICESLGLPGAEFSRGYIQHWLSGEEIPDASARRIFGAADRILKAGRPEAAAKEVIAAAPN